MSDEQEHAWTTAQGDDILVRDMDTGHVRNALRLVQRWIDRGPPEFPLFQGEMAQYYAEHAFEAAVERYDEAPYWVKVFEEELAARKRGERKEWLPCA